MQWRHSNVHVLCTGALAEGIQDLGAAVIACSALQDILAGKAAGGKIKAAAERGGVVSGLGELAAVTKTGIAMQCSTTCDFLCVLYGEEATEEGQLAVLEALTKWFARLGSVAEGAGQLPPSVVPFLVSGVQSKKDSLRTAFLGASVSLLGGQERWVASACSLLLPHVSKLVGEGATKVPARC